MTPEAYQRVREVFALVHDAPPDEVDAALRVACAGDAVLHAQVRALLAADERAAGFMTVSDAPSDDANAFDASSLPEIPGYTVRRRIAVGGMGEVFEAEQHDPRRTVAIKIVRSGAASLERFRNEIQILARLSHPGIAKVYASGTVTIGGSELPYFAMEFIHGESITAYARRHALDHAARVALLARVCDAVEHAHRAGVLHRDLKPPNILVDADGAPHVLDFGVARATDGDSAAQTLHTRPGQLIGTLPYMSPEQVAGEPDAIDHTCDVYALGVVLYELLADRLPLDVLQTSLADAARIITEEEPTRLGTVERSLRGDLETIVGKAMEKEKSRRYLSAAALAADLRRSLASQPIEAHPPSALYQLRTFARRHRAIVNGVLATFLVLTIGIITTTLVALSAVSNAREASFGSYRSRIAAAQSALALDDPTAARVHLDAAPAALRDWEWRYLAAVVDPTSAHHAVEGPLVPAAFAFAADGEPLHLRARAGALELVPLRTPAFVRRTLTPFAAGPRALAERGTHAAAVDPDTRTLHLWSLDDDDPFLGSVALDALSAPVTELCFSHDGSTLAVVTDGPDATIVTVDVASAAITTTRTVTALERVVLSADGRRLLYICAAAPSSYAPIGIVDLTTDTLRQLMLENFSHVDSAVAFSPDGSTIAVGLDQFARRIVLIDATTLNPVGELGGHQFAVRGVCFSRDRRRVASISHQVILVHDLVTGEIVSTSSIPGHGVVHGFLGTPAHDEFLVLTTDAQGEHLATLARTARPMSQVLHGHETYVYQLAFDATSSRLASVDYDGRIIVWDVTDGRVLQTLEHGAPQSIAFLRDGSALLSDARRFDLKTGTSAFIPLGAPGVEWMPRVPTSAPLATGVVYEGGAISADQAWFIGSVFQNTQYHAGARDIRAVATGEIVQHFPSTSPLPARAVAFNHDRTRLAVGRTDGGIEMHDLERETCRLEIPAHTSTVFTVNFSPDGRRLASGGNDNTVRLFDVETGHEVLALRGHTSYVHCVAFSPDGRVLASASGDGTVRLWRAPRPREGEE